MLKNIDIFEFVFYLINISKRFMSYEIVKQNLLILFLMM